MPRRGEDPGHTVNPKTGEPTPFGPRERTKTMQTYRSSTRAEANVYKRRGHLHILGDDYLVIQTPMSSAQATELAARARALGVSRNQLVHDICALWLHLTKRESLRAALAAGPIIEHTPGYAQRLVPGWGDAGLPHPPDPRAHAPHEVRPDISLIAVEPQP